MLALLRHRGPDEAGYYIDDCAALGTTRLSIIDLQSGSQPIGDAQGRYWICFNGEIYNYIELRQTLQQLGHRFQTASDTEVLLQAWLQWGTDALRRCNGAFACAVYDGREGTLFLARDRYGKRPLFYTEQAGVFAFASEMKSFLALERFRFEPDAAQLASIYSYWTPLPWQTGYANVHQLPMGETLRLDADGLHRQRYYSLDFNAPPFSADSVAAAAAVREAVDEAVRLRLRSDVDVGVYLSGGLDSTVVTDSVSRQTDKTLHTFSVEFDDPTYDESADQKLVAERYGTAHQAVHISARDIVDHLPQAVYHAEVPVFRTAFVPMLLLSQLVQEAGIKVVLSGEGADETFLGYNIFKETLLRQQWEALDPETRKQRLMRLYPYLRHYAEENLPQLLALYQRHAKEQTPGLFSHEMRFQSALLSKRLLSGRHDALQEINRLLEQEPYFFGLSAVEKAQWLEFKTLLAGYLLSTQGERMGLAHGVENRCPFLDPNVVRLAAAVNLRFDDGLDEKHLLKQAFAGRIPESLRRKPKQPYRAPDAASFVRHRPEYLDLLLSEQELAKIELLNPKFCSALANKVLTSEPESLGVNEHSAFIFLITTALVHRYFVQRQDLPAAASQGIGDILVRVVDRRRARQKSGAMP